MYERKTFLAGLGQEVRVLKGPGFAYGVLPNGARVGLAELRQMDLAARRNRHGYVEPGFSVELEEAPATKRLSAMVYFRPLVDWHAIVPRLFGKDSAAAGAARAELEEGIALAAAGLVPELAAAGAKVRLLGSKMSGIYLETTAEHLRALGRDPRIQLVTDAEPLRPRHLCNAGPDKRLEDCDADPTVFHQTDVAFNSIGLYGAPNGVPMRVGLLEDVGNCELEAGHEAFQHSGGIFYNSTFAAGCVAGHGTSVASVISGSNDGERCGASDVEFYYANDGVGAFFPEDFNTVLPASATQALP